MDSHLWSLQVFIYFQGTYSSSYDWDDVPKLTSASSPQGSSSRCWPDSVTESGECQMSTSNQMLILSPMLIRWDQMSNKSIGPCHLSQRPWHHSQQLLPCPAKQSSNRSKVQPAMQKNTDLNLELPWLFNSFQFEVQACRTMSLWTAWVIRTDIRLFTLGVSWRSLLTHDTWAAACLLRVSFPLSGEGC